MTTSQYAALLLAIFLAGSLPRWSNAVVAAIFFILALLLRHYGG